MIKLQFVCEHALSSQMIAWFGGGTYSHVDAVMLDGSLLGARGDGVKIRPPGYDPFTLLHQYELSRGCGSSVEERFMAFLHAQIGKPYDYEAIAGFVVGRDWRSPEHWFCSELAAAALETSFAMPVLDVPVSKITPDGLALAFVAAGAKACGDS